MLMAQRGQEPDPNKIPLSYEDLSYDGQLALLIYGKLGNRVYGDVGFTGKDFTVLPILIQHHEIIDADLLLDYLNIIDNHNINKSQETIKKMTDKIEKHNK